MVLPEADGHGAFLHRRMRLLRGVDDEPGAHAILPRLRLGFFSGADEGVHGAGAGRVVDDAEELLRQAQPLAQPPQRNLFQLGHRGRGLPVQAVGVHGGNQHLRQNAGRAGRGAKVSHEAGMIPLRHGRQNLALEVSEDGREALAMIGRRGGQGIHQLAGTDPRLHGHVANVRQVLGNPFDAIVRRAAEIFDVAFPGGLALGIRQMMRHDFSGKDDFSARLAGGRILCVHCEKM